MIQGDEILPLGKEMQRFHYFHISRMKRCEKACEKIQAIDQKVIR